MDLQDLNALGFSGRTLNIEERAGLEVAIAKRRLEDGLQDLGFWGKVYGDEDDYLVVVGYGPSEDYPAKRFFYTYVLLCSHYLRAAVPENACQVCLCLGDSL